MASAITIIASRRVYIVIVALKMRNLSLFTILLTATSVMAAGGFKRQEKPMLIENLGPAMPPANTNSSASSAQSEDAVILSDVLGKDRSINIFASLIRDIDSADTRMADGNSNTTVLAPVNSAIVALPRRPWESNEDYEQLGENAYEGQSGQDRASSNLKRFVFEHIVPESPWKEGSRIATLAGSQVWWETKDDKRYVSNNSNACKDRVNEK